MKVLFVCNQNMHRSKTAEKLFKDRFDVKSAGLYGGKLLSERHLKWADVVVVMEDFQRNEIGKRFPNEYMKKRIICFDIPDIYHFDQPELVKVLKSKVDMLV